MPAIITHDAFGQRVYHERYNTIGNSRDEMDAFLLGNQGPDPLFYAFLQPSLRAFCALGSTMHRDKTNELLAAFCSALEVLPSEEQDVGRAYVTGFLCHYLLDSAMHPFVYAQQYALCDAGVPGLTRDDGREVHGLIESELDEMVLFCERGLTVKQFNPSTEILHAREAVLNTISKLYSYIGIAVYGQAVPPRAFATAVHDFRFIQGVFHSPTGIKRELIARAEELVRAHSFYRAMSHRAVACNTCHFDNHEHNTWENPFTNEESREGFWDIFKAAETRALAAVATFPRRGFTVQAARAITRDRDFSGRPTVAEILTSEEVCACSK